MNYRHAYHAGNFADVFKHIVLMMVVESLLKKEKPFCYLDTHAGIGCYDLRGREAQKTKEYASGIEALLLSQVPKPDIIKRYVNIILRTNPTSKLQFYPGSPLIVRELLRPDDRMILSELHPDDAMLLKGRFKQDKQVAVHTMNGYQALKAFLPPKPRRGLVLVDPPYEDKNEFQTILKSLKMAKDRWAEGIYLIWYPVKDRFQITKFMHQLQRSAITNILMVELNLYPDDSPLALNGSGFVIVNPPWQLKKELSSLLPWLLSVLDPERRGNYQLKRLS